MMLASTVQFSRYDPQPATPHAISAGDKRPGEVTSRAAVPPGPNSVPGPRNPWDLAFHAAVPEGTQSAVLTSPGSCPDRITSAPLMSCHLRTFASDVALDAADCVCDTAPVSARCSLERR